MPNRPVSGPFGESYLGDQLRRNPMSVAQARLFRRSGEGRRVARDAVELLLQLGAKLVAEAGANPARIYQLTLLVHAENQRGEWQAFVGRRGSGDDEFLPLAASD